MLRLLFPLRCPCCGTHAEGPCHRCLRAFSPAPSLPPIDGLTEARAVFAYADGADHVVLACKARGCHALVGHMAAEMAPLLDPGSGSVLTWIPTSPDRARQRGFDQAELLAIELGRICGLPVSSLLRRESAAQHGRGRTSRGSVCFRVPSGAAAAIPAGAAVVLIDDVRTTGASLSAAAVALRAAGFPLVAGLTYAATAPRARVGSSEGSPGVARSRVSESSHSSHSSHSSSTQTTRPVQKQV